jgi:lysophospholipase L1-like esterase
MSKKSVLFLLIAFSLFPPAIAQNANRIVWWNPATSGFPVIEGQAWPGEVAGPFDRLPARAQKSVRPDVWDLSHNGAGLIIRFRTNSPKISVRYTVGGNLNMPHMPTTGVSGLDLYAKNSDGAWLWSMGKYSYGDTIACQFSNIDPKDAYHDQGREYRLYLPLYNSVRWLEIGVPEGTLFSALPVRKEKPIVVYGTSIAQGACASRPGMAWTAITGRELDRPLINLGFSGNGRLEPELTELIAEIDAAIYILDCLPNIYNPKDFPREEVIRRITATVTRLRELHPHIPILLADHAGYTDGSLNPVRMREYTEVNQVQHEAFASLVSAGITDLYLLPRESIGLTLDAMVDGTHPSDLGMQQYADGYIRIIRTILWQPAGNLSTTIPCTQYREPGMYDWEGRHQELLEMNRENPPRTVFIGNSITHYWAGKPSNPVHRGVDSWEKVLDPLGTRNFGFGWDRIENVLWRVYHDELDGYRAERVIINIGTNNLHLNSDAEILSGMEQLLNAVKTRQPGATIILLGLYPRRDQESRIALLNLEYARLSANLNIRYADVGQDLLKPDGKIDESLFTDGLHPNADGYRKIADRLGIFLKQIPIRTGS